MDFKINFGLIEHLRAFSMENQDFSAEFLIQLKNLIADFLKENSEFSLNYKDSEMLIVSLHFYFSAIYNLDNLLQKLNFKREFNKCNKFEFNKTNIMSLHTLKDALGSLKNNQIYESSKQTDSYFPNIKFSFEDSNTDHEILSLSKELLDLGFQSKGKIDIHIVSYICDLVNERFGTNLVPILVAKMKNLNPYFLKQYSNTGLKMIEESKKVCFNEDRFNFYQKKLVNLIKEQAFDNQNTLILHELLIDIECELEEIISFSNEEDLSHLEKLLIGMMGHPFEKIRNAAICYLNVLYDGVNWQLRGNLNPRISTEGESFKIDYLIEVEDEHSVVLLVNAPSFSSLSDSQVITWHRPIISKYKFNKEQVTTNIPISKENNLFTVSLDLGPFRKCGFYDWKLFTLQQGGKLKGIAKIYSLKNNDIKVKGNFNDLGSLNLYYKDKLIKQVQGRYIVHPKKARDLQIQEIYPDLLGEMLYPKSSDVYMIKGNYQNLKSSLKIFREMRVNCLYLLGVLERDYESEKNKSLNSSKPRKPQNPLAVSSRTDINLGLGSNEDFKELIKVAEDEDILIVTDSITRVNSKSRRKYWDHFLNFVDDSSKKLRMYGCDGKALEYEDTIMLNYRKKECWDLMVSDIIKFVDKYGIHGIHLDFCHDWPQIYKLNEEEMLKVEKDDNEQEVSVYSDKEIFEGIIIDPKECQGFWESSYLFIKKE